MSLSQQPGEYQPAQPVAPETRSAEENEWEEELADARRRLAAVVETLETEDDTPVDNLFSAKQQRLLTRTLYSSWTPPPKAAAPAARRSFLADANIGLFFLPHQPPLVPDFFLSLDVRPHDNWYAQEHRSYFFWEFGKPPEVVVEIVSNRQGGELSDKLQRYAEIDITYYAVYDPVRLLSPDVLRVYEREAGRRYHLRDDLRLPEVGLSIGLWEGVFEDHRDTWLRWYDHEDQLILTGQERAILAEDRALHAEERAAQTEERATQAEERATQAEERAARLAAQLRELGIEPEPSS
jgi:Uma2 family endonuclease